MLFILYLQKIQRKWTSSKKARCEQIERKDAPRANKRKSKKCDKP